MPTFLAPNPIDLPLARRLAARFDADVTPVETRRFPDGETYVRVGGDVDRDAVIVASLHRPDDKLLPVAFLADAARDLGAERVILVAPYLAYLRQDRRFKSGEAVSSRTFARIVSGVVDGLVTVDPHLHRYAALEEIYAIPCRVLHAAAPIAAWIRANVERPVLVGPDVESAQWVHEAAQRAAAPSLVLDKVRRGDRDVEVSLVDVERWRDHTPVLVDDIVSTARTLVATVERLRGLRPPVCVGVHALFAGDALEALHGAGAGVVVSTDTVPHATNAIPVDDLIADGLATLLIGRPAAPGCAA